MKHGVTRARVYEYIRDFRTQNGYSPSFREIADGLGVGLATVDHHVLHLKAEGLITYKNGVARSIVVL